MGTPSSPVPDLLVQLRVSDLREIIATEVREGIRIALAANGPPVEWLDTKGVADLIGVHPRSVAQYVRRGLPCTHLGPKTVRYERAAVLAWISARPRLARKTSKAHGADHG